MDGSDGAISDLVVGLLESWTAWRPDQSCRVCYECDSNFTLFNRRHHCRLCGRIFCAKCTSNRLLTEPSEEDDRIRVCNYCFNQCERGECEKHEVILISLLARDISLVLNIKKPLLERIACCTGAQIAPTIDHLSSEKVGYCDMFNVTRFTEEHGSADQPGKKAVKTLMYFEGCPKPQGFTILVRGASVDELKKVKHVIQYGVFAAYHLALETSFLADEGASLPDKQSAIDVFLDGPGSVQDQVPEGAYFLMVPDQWSPPTSQTEMVEDNSVEQVT